MSAKVRTALFCERVLVEGDGTVSLIRIFDTLVAVRPADQRDQLPPPHRYDMFLDVRATDPGDLVITVRRPDGSTQVVIGSHRVEAPAAGQEGWNVPVVGHMKSWQEGIYLFDIAFDGELLRSLPLKVEIKDEEAAK